MISSQPVRSLPFIGSWLEDESLYSWCSRHHKLTRHSTRSTGMALFGVPSAAKSKYTIANLPYFEAVTEGLLGTGHEILRTRTSMGAFVSLTTSSSRRPEAQELQYPSWAGLKMGALCSLRYCEICRQQHREQHGTCMWRIEHQLPGVAVCRKHFCILREVTYHGQVWALPGDLPDTALRVVHSRELEILMGVANAATSIFHSEHLEIAELKMRATLLLCDAYGVVDGKHLDPSKVQTDWEASSLAHWLNREAPRLVCCAAGWISDLLRGRNSASNPMRWALLAGYLNERGLALPEVLFSRQNTQPNQMDFWDDAEHISPAVLQAFICSTCFAEVAHRLGVATTTVRRWAQRMPALAVLVQDWRRVCSTLAARS